MQLKCIYILSFLLILIKMLVFKLTDFYMKFMKLYKEVNFI